MYAAKQREEDVLGQTMAVPLQNVRAFANGSTADGVWKNRLIFGDNLQALKTLLTDPTVAGRVKFVYIDPPFATKQEFSGSKDQKAYQDKIAGAAFLEFLRKRLIFLREMLHPTGAIAVHLDVRKGHYVKVLLDEIFGEHSFRNEVIWKRTGARSGSNSFNHIHDNIYVYSRSASWTWNVQHTAYTSEYIEDFFTGIDPDGRKFRATILTASGTRSGSSGQTWRGYDPTAAGRHWAIPGYIRPSLDLPPGADTLAALDNLEAIGRVIWPKRKADGSAPSFKQYLDEMAGVELQSIWTDIKPVAAKAREQADYPTQKPEALLARLIRAFTNGDDLVLDCFAGAGTTSAVAEKLGRRWIGIDSGKLAIYKTQRRLLHLHREIGDRGPKLKTRPFVLQNAGLYDFSALRDLPWEDWRFFALRLFEARDRPHSIGRLKLDGERRGGPVLVFDWKASPSAHIGEDTIDDLYAAIGSLLSGPFYIIAPMLTFDFQQDYVDRGDVRFYALRIPYSIVHELHSREFEAVLQARDEAGINAITEAYGFSFIVAPEVHWSVLPPEREPDGPILLRTDRFISRAKVKGTETHGGKDTLSILLIDVDYQGDVFDLDLAFLGRELEQTDWVATIPRAGVGDRIMAIWIDHHGNEAKSVIPRAELRL